MADKGNNKLHTLIPLDEFKSLSGIDDRDDKLCRFALEASTFNIEHYCKRKFLRKKHFETIVYYGELYVPLREYPVSNVLVVYINGEILEPDYYSVIPECSTEEDLPFNISISPALCRNKYFKFIKAIYFAGYAPKNVPADLKAACMELASWNMSRYKGRRIGMTGNIRGSGKEGEHFELSIPENVRTLLEPYKRRVI
jgi:hypothetical protein